MRESKPPGERDKHQQASRTEARLNAISGSSDASLAAVLRWDSDDEMNYSRRGETRDKVITGDVGGRGRASTEDDSSRRLPGLSMSAMFG
jgi:hypothetical protein